MQPDLNTKGPPVSPLPTGWTRDNRAAWAVCAATLSTGGLWWGLHSACAVLQLATSLLAPGPNAGAALLAWMSGAMLIWLAGTWLAMRVQLDARLMHDMARGDAGPLPDALALDGALRSALNVSARAPERPPSDRVRGALRLHRLLVLTTVCQALCLLLRGVASFLCC